MSYKSYIVQPRDPLIARDGRPFQNSPGARARTLPFVLPPTLAGAIRTQAGMVNGRFDITQAKSVLQHGLRGPLLVQLHSDGLERFVPAPLDALMLDSKYLYALKPYKIENDVLTDLATPYVVGSKNLDLRAKPNGMPNFWRWQKFAEWLLQPRSKKEVSPQELGIKGPELEYRTHVGMDYAKQTAKEGALFQTSGLEFIHSPSPHHLSQTKGLALLFATNAPNQASGMGTLGGERRLMYWQPTPELFDCNDWCTKVAEKVTQTGQDQFFCRVILLTPAYFTNGYTPTWLLTPQHGVAPQLMATACNRPVVVSGWDYATARPKPTRRLAPAGSVYFLRLIGSKQNVKEWVASIWMHNVSDDPAQNRLDGLGLAVVGAWEGVEDDDA